MNGNGAGRRALLCFAGNDWWLHNPLTEKQWMRRLARDGWKILFVNSIGIGLPSPQSPKMLQRVLRKALGMLRWLRRSESVWVLTPVVLPFWSWTPVARVNVLLLAAQIRLLLLLLRMRRPVFWSGIPTAALLADRIPHRGILYYVQDNYLAYFDAMLFSSVADHHAMLLRRADTVVYASIGLFELHAERSRARYLPHGVAEPFFAPDLDADHPLPRELQGLPRPIVGYWGSLEAMQDIPLITALARLRPAWSLVFIGRPMLDQSPFRDLPNVHFLGYVPPERLPAYGIHFDVATIPWVQTPWAAYSCPVKVREYYALGRPVVSVPIVEIERKFPDARIARTAEEFAAAVEALVAGDGPEQRRQRRLRVRAETWDATVAELQRILLELPVGGGAVGGSG